MDIENINSNISNPAMQDDDHIEQLLSEKLMEGYVLLEKSCPVCCTPLVKDTGDEEDDLVHKEIDPVMIPKGSFIQPFVPVQGVPLCVACTSHVVTQENEVGILAKCGSLKAKGGVLVAAKPSENESTLVAPVKEAVIIDVTEYEQTLGEPTHTEVSTEEKKEETYAEEKKEEEEDDAVDETMLEYSVRYVHKQRVQLHLY